MHFYLIKTKKANSVLTAEKGKKLRVLSSGKHTFKSVAFPIIRARINNCVNKAAKQNNYVVSIWLSKLHISLKGNLLGMNRNVWGDCCSKCF